MSTNLFTRFQKLLRQPPLRVGDVIAYDAGVARIEEAGGGHVQARGETTVGARVFFRDGVIEGPAPDLTVEIIEV
jgi:hypothetical protein